MTQYVVTEQYKSWLWVYGPYDTVTEASKVRYRLRRREQSPTEFHVKEILPLPPEQLEPDPEPEP